MKEEKIIQKQHSETNHYLKDQSRQSRDGSENLTKNMTDKKESLAALFDIPQEKSGEKQVDKEVAKPDTLTKSTVQESPKTVDRTSNQTKEVQLQSRSNVSKHTDQNKKTVHKLSTKSADIKNVSSIKSNVTKPVQNKKPVTPPKTNNEKKSVAEAIAKNISENENVDKAISHAYKKIKHSVISDKNQNQPKKKNAKPRKDKYKIGYSQDIIPIKSIRNGIIQTTSGMYVKIVEILPIDFNSMTVNKRSDIAHTFASFFHNGPSRVHLKCITDKTNPERLINFIKEKCEEEKWQRGISSKVVECAQDVINKIMDISDSNALTKRYFMIYRYEGRSTNINEICSEMNSIKQSIVMTFANTGNTVVDYGFEKSSYEAGEILYYFFNRKTCREESFQERINRISSDYELYNANANTKKTKVISDVDYFAPKGLYFTNREYIMMDGLYKTYIALKENGHPSYAEPGWIDNFTSIGDGTEVDIEIERTNHDSTYSILDQMNRIKIVGGNSKKNNPSKQNEIFTEARNTAYITEHMATGEDLFNVSIIITLSADTIRELRTLKNLVIKQLNRQKLYCEEAYANTKLFYMATLPLMEASMDIINGNEILIRNKRNYLTSSLESLYMFTSLELTDPTGILLGENMDSNNHSAVAINPFNTTIFPNANISIFGMSGSGKTYSTEIIARAMRILGIRVFFILPMKAHEYFKGCEAIDGTFIQLGPGANDRINVMEIRPAQNIDRNVLRESSAIDECLLSGKISFLITWIQLNMQGSRLTMEEQDILEDELVRLYNDFGITRDNNSIFEDDGSLKYMPIIGDMYDRFLEIPELSRVTRNIKKYVTGNCANMNGQTNVDLTSKYICFNVDEKKMSKDLLAPFVFVATDCCYNLIRENRLSLDVLFMDEVWRLLIQECAGEQVKDMVKIVRGYGGAVVPITQDIDDYLGSPYGKAILGNTSIKIIMYLEEPQCRTLAKELGLSEDDIKTITSFKRGQAMILTSKLKIKVNIRSSDKEDEEFTTDPNKLREYAQRKSLA